MARPVAIVGLSLAAIWAAVVGWQFVHPDDLPSLWVDTVPMAGAALLGLAAAAAGVVGVAMSQRRRRWMAIGLAGLLAMAGPISATAGTFRTFNDWNLANRAFISALFPAFALQLQQKLDRLEELPHFWIHHHAAVPQWEAARLESHWRDLHDMLGSAPTGKIELYLYEPGEVSTPLGNGAAYGRLVFGRSMSGPTGCATVLHEISHAFMYTRSGTHSFPQLLDEGWARANQGCDRTALDAAVVQATHFRRLPPLEFRLTAEGFSAAMDVDGYAVGGSFVRFLLDTYGIGPFLAFIDHATIDTTVPAAERAYGIPFRSLERQWLDHLSTEFALPGLAFTSP